MPAQLPSVTVVGLGPMGRAMAGTLLDHAVPVTVFNRTASRADAVVAAGARRATSAEDALDAADLVIVSLTHYRAMYDLLEPAADRLAGRVLVNLSSDTPREAERAAAWAARHGAEFLTGGIMVPATLVGDDTAYAFYSGPRAVLDRWSDTLGLLARPEYVGADPSLALLWYQALLDLFMTTLVGASHAAALMKSAGVQAGTFLPYASDLLAQMPFFLEGAAEEIDRREYPDVGASLAMMAAGIDHITVTSEDAQIDSRLPAAVRELYRRALDLGFGRHGSGSVYEAIVAPSQSARGVA
ncbi:MULTISPECIES: NAD(P)-dependent oxidoreductase [Rhodococcus]|nr:MULTISPECIES: NAD(P)-binding domain-containing protein [Rhodococcus]QQZ14036.1 NAD(P)-dependent oxidoreductase [Rhodococcus sp. 21391]